MRLMQKVALVTGAARGIGKEIAIALGAEGARVILADLLTDVNETAQELQNLGYECSAITGDVSNFNQAQEMVDKVIETYGQIDILINNAGITRDNLLLRMSEEEWDKVIAINLKGTFNLTKAAVKPMMKKRAGNIVNIASVIGVMGNAGQANYAASKAGVIGFTKSMAKELGSRGIRVNAVAPGFIQSKMTDVLSEEIKSNLLKQIPLGSLGLPEHVAKAVVFLVSSESEYITGQVLNVDGGMVM